MKNEKVKIRSIEYLTHDVLKIVTDKPAGLNFHPGQATEVAINKPGWKKEGRPFTFTNLPSDDFVEFGIKSYTDHDGVTHQLRNLKAGDELLLTDVFGAIEYKGKGTFIAGGAGLTPFLSILRDLKSKGELDQNVLLFGNKTSKDIILESELHEMLGNNFHNILSDEKHEKYAQGFIDAEFIQKNALSLNDYFYLCGPTPMMNAVEKHLASLGVSSDRIVKEQ